MKPGFILGFDRYIIGLCKDVIYFVCSQCNTYTFPAHGMLTQLLTSLKWTLGCMLEITWNYGETIQYYFASMYLYFRPVCVVKAIKRSMFSIYMLIMFNLAQFCTSE